MSATLPDGHNVTAVTADDEGGFTTEWSDGRTSGPTNTLDEALLRRQRARSTALRLFLKRK